VPPSVSPIPDVGGAPGPVAPTGLQRSDPTSISEVAKWLFRFARADSKVRVLPAVERELIIQALKETTGNQVQAAKLLGITRATLRKRVEKFGIRRELTVE
jgi:two-component system nitrogen regulation response regulator GlnG